VIPDLRVLCIEDSEDDVILLRRNLRKEGFDPLVYQVTNSEEMKDALDLHEWDVIICDYLMPNFNIQSALGIVYEMELDLPFIIVSGTISDEAAVSMMKLGAHDYILKENLSRLAPAIRREMEEAQHRRERRVVENALHESERKHRLLVQSMSDNVFVLSKSGIIVEYYSSSGFGEIKEPAEIPGKHIQEVTPGTNAVLFEEMASRVLNTNQSMTFESFYHIGNRRKWFSANLNPHEDKKHVVVVTREITDLKTAEEEIRAAHRMATLYLDLLGHDIRNYLQAVMISADLIGESLSSHRDRDLLEQITQSIERCQSIITNVQSTGDLLSSSMNDMCLCKSVKDTVSEFERALNAFCKGNYEESNQHLERLFQKEVEVDELRRAVFEEMTKGELSLKFREDLKSLVGRLDQMADHVKDSARAVKILIKGEAKIPQQLLRLNQRMAKNLVEWHIS